MKIKELIAKQERGISFEFFPPKTREDEDQLFKAIAELESFSPAFVSVTYGAGGGTLKNTRQVILRIKRETSLTPMPHLTCVDQSADELKDILEDYKEQGIENVLALRGDPPKGTEKFVAPPNGFCYAIDLVELGVSVGGYSIGVAVYPEGHIESPSLEMDMHYTKQKIDAGADFAITQMFFDNRFFYDFMERAEKAGINVPIIPGIMPITDIEKIKRFSQISGATLPPSLVERMQKAKSADEARQFGIDFTTGQCQDLWRNGVRYFHFYTLNRSQTVTEILRNLGLVGVASSLSHPPG
jgi:methylenetetrahydrofolate reductase (NADPH)